MRKTIALSAALLCMTSLGFSQTEIGVKAGYNYLNSSYESTPVPGSGANYLDLKGGGYHFGGYYSNMPMDNVFLSAEVLISNRRWNELFTNVNEGSEVMTQAETFTFYSNYYLEIPLSIKYGINMRKSRYGDNKYLMFYAGPTTNILMGTKGYRQETFRVDTHQQTTVTQEETRLATSDLKAYFTPIQVGLHGGIQFSFEFGLNIDLRYQHLLMPVSIDTENFGQLKQGIASISIGYSFFRD